MSVVREQIKRVSEGCHRTVVILVVKNFAYQKGMEKQALASILACGLINYANHIQVYIAVSTQSERLSARLVPGRLRSLYSSKYHIFSANAIMATTSVECEVWTADITSPCRSEVPPPDPVSILRSRSA